MKFVTTFATSGCVKFFQLCKFFPEKNVILCKICFFKKKTTHLFGEFTHTFPPKPLIFYIFNSISPKFGPRPFLLKFTLFQRLAQKVAIHAFLVCKNFGKKIWLCKIFDKFHVCILHFFAYLQVGEHIALFFAHLQIVEHFAFFAYLYICIFAGWRTGQRSNV